jgi:hypothetical protein
MGVDLINRSVTKNHRWVYETKTIQANRSAIMNGIQRCQTKSQGRLPSRRIAELFSWSGSGAWLIGERSSRSGAVYIDGGVTGSVRSRVCRTDVQRPEVGAESVPTAQSPEALLPYLFLLFFYLRSWDIPIQKYTDGSVIFQWDTNTVISLL